MESQSRGGARSQSRSTVKKQPSGSEHQEDPASEIKRLKDLMSLKPPKPETAPNRFLARLFEAP